MLIFAIIIVVVALVLLLIYYNRLVRLRYLVQEAWSGIDVQLKKRAELIPNLVSIVKGYASHEKNTLESVLLLRGEALASNQPSERMDSENALALELQKVLVLAEAYPELKAEQSFRELQYNLTKIEDDLQYARRYYNGAVRNFNIAVQSFPSNLVARVCGFESRSFFEIAYASEREVPDVELE